MELGLGLGLSLGDAPKFMENKVQKQQQQLQKSGSKNTRGPDFCMALSFKSCAVLENQRKEETKKSQESDEDDEISEEDGSHYNIGETPLQLNLLPLAPLFPRHISNRPWSSDNGSWENGSSGNMGLAAAKALDVNRRQGAAAAAEEVPSANSVGWSPFHMDYGMYRTDRSSANGKHLSKKEFAATRNDVVVEVERARDDEDDDEENGAQNRKKLKLSKQQSAFLEETFKQHNSLNPKQKLALAKQLHLRPRQVEVWFQNRRARTKLKQTEVDCDYLKRFCYTLREENRRLQKELQEVRVLNTSNIPFYMSQLPPTTLTICPSCQRAAAPAAAPPPKAVPVPPKHVQILPFFANSKSS